MNGGGGGGGGGEGDTKLVLGSGDDFLSVPRMCYRCDGIDSGSDGDGGDGDSDNDDDAGDDCVF